MLGVVNIQQNNIIKIFSIAAVVLMPPTLIASIYGMNFKHMPELDWHFGYPFALVVMVLAACCRICISSGRSGCEAARAALRRQRAVVRALLAPPKRSRFGFAKASAGEGGGAR